MMATVSSEAVAAYRPHVEELARKVYAERKWLLDGAGDYDDLEQEGLIAVWLCLSRRTIPTDDVIEGRMRDYVSWLRRRKAVPYEAMLPMDDYAAV